LQFTLGLLENIEARLKSQTAYSNKNIHMPPELLRACSKYVEDFYPKIVSTGNVQYSGFSDEFGFNSKFVVFPHYSGDHPLGVLISNTTRTRTFTVAELKQGFGWQPTACGGNGG
jgi:hypothetical protein